VQREELGDESRVWLRASRRRFSLEMGGVLPRHRRSPAAICVRWVRSSNKIAGFEFSHDELARSEEGSRFIDSWRTEVPELDDRCLPEDHGPIVARNPVLRETRNARGHVGLTVLSPQSPVPKLFQVLAGVRIDDQRQKTIDLDMLGSFLWDRCAEPTRVRTLAREFQTKLVLAPAEARLSVREYVRSLASRGLVELRDTVEPKDG
jgi:Coenzyme PQQ synthesis protein D (PqqD)